MVLWIRSRNPSPAVHRIHEIQSNKKASAFAKTAFAASSARVAFLKKWNKQRQRGCDPQSRVRSYHIYPEAVEAKGSPNVVENSVRDLIRDRNVVVR